MTPAHRQLLWSIGAGILAAIVTTLILRAIRQRQKAKGGPWHVVAFQWVTKPLCDHDGQPSITRCLAIYYAILVGHSVEHNPTHELTTNALWLALASMSAAFGKSTFTFLLSKAQLAATSTQATITKYSTAVVEHIRSTRDKETGEPGPFAPGQEPKEGAADQ